MEKANQSLFKKIISFRETSLTLIILCLMLILTFVTPGFLTKYNINTTLIGLSMDGIMAVGMVLVLVLGGIDLSVGSVMALSNVTAGIVAMHYGLNIWLSVLIAMFISILAGLTIGKLITKIKLNPFITTLSMMSIARGIAYIFTEGSPVSLGEISVVFDWIGRGKILGIPNPGIILLLIVIVMDFLMRKSKTFREIYYIGSNEQAAAFSGINVNKRKLMVYILCSFLSGLAGVITLARFGVATPTAGVGAELRAIAGAVIGGASLNGGEGTVLGALLGIILVALVNNALVLLNVSVYWQSLVTGLVLLTAVIVDMRVHNKKN
ncbi:ABC transporter permease [Iocasia frigidifontis]|uniref:ABC transporter permease n=1 Tax=Iocasia fonsfrigidae TaxID=2682810 RepID=A0A8A7K7A7_9FIRM|nr:MULTISPECIES: ABC transporter permease [Halanaerobiaceae]AZO94677.1 ABC transporter permease [Halocella sp. SP3-1]QTL97606.1 ABC transporter permease [Iocasia fonsfrigidae]